MHRLLRIPGSESLEAPFAQLVQSRLVGPLHSSQAEEQRRHRRTEAWPGRVKSRTFPRISAVSDCRLSGPAS